MIRISTAQTLTGILTLLFASPLWFTLVFSILKMVEATDVMWWLYWSYVPIVALANILARVGPGDQT